MFGMRFFRRPSRLVRLLALVTSIAAAVSAGPAVAAPRRAAPGGGDVNAAWQFPAKNWSSSNKEAGRVDDILRIGKRVFIGGNFTITRTTAARP